MTYVTNEHRAVLDAGLTWLFDTEQPDTAVLQHPLGHDRRSLTWRHDRLEAAMETMREMGSDG